jgi:hypothetical protein
LPDGFAVPVAVAAAALAVVAAPSASAKQQPTAQVGYHAWTTSDDFAAGSFAGAQPAAVGDGAITFSTSAGTLDYTDPFDAAGTLPTSYDYDAWTSPVYDVGFGLTELVASWTADTPPGTWIQVEMHGTTTTGVTTKWYVMGRWSSQMPSDTGDIHRTSVGSQGDSDGTVAIDTFFAAKKVALTNYQLRVTLYRKAGSSAAPTVRSVGALTSARVAAQ